eukprot:9371443-Karenia_brevis.AAC.1
MLSWIMLYSTKSSRTKWFRLLKRMWRSNWPRKRNNVSKNIVTFKQTRETLEQQIVAMRNWKNRSWLSITITRVVDYIGDCYSSSMVD